MANKKWRHKHPNNEGYINVSAVLSNLNKVNKNRCVYTDYGKYIWNPRFAIKHDGDE